jgi:hypothetical protein
MTINDGTVLGTIKVINHGSPVERRNLVIMGDGYKVAELIKFHNDVDSFINKLENTHPFGELWDAINIYRIDVSSTDSGADDPVACGGTGVLPETTLTHHFVIVEFNAYYS